MKPMATARPWTIRPEAPGDEEAIDLLLRRAFGGENAARLVKILRTEHGYDPALSLVAEETQPVKRLVGYVLFSPIAIVRGEAPSPAMALGPLAILPDRQRTGIGTALVEAGLERCRTRGLALVLVLGDPAYYDRFGFTPAANASIEAPYPAWGSSYQVLALLPGALRDARGLARYPEAWRNA